MRAAFGLVGILVTLGVIVWFLAAPGGGLDHTAAVIKAGDKARDQVSQMAGKDAQTGERASESIEMEGLTTGGKLNGILVTKITDGGAYQRFFGLQRNDTIVGIEYQGNHQKVKDFSAEDDAKVQVEEAYTHQGSLYVVRDEKEIKLPVVAPAGSAKAKDGLQGQLDAIQGAGGR